MASDENEEDMLFVLNGDIQTGKTRWLCDVCEEIASLGVVPFGVVAPGIWRRPEDPGHVTISGGMSCAEVDAIDWTQAPSRPADKNGFEKLGIVNTLLPRREGILFALRRDVAVAAGKLDEESQSEKAKLGWHMSDGAISRVDGHFRRALEAGILSAASDPEAPSTPSASGAPITTGVPSAKEAFLVVDELGRLELMRGEGLVSAMRLLEQGPTKECPCALVVVRSALAYLAEERFGDIWGGVMSIHADESGRGVLLGTLHYDLQFS